MSDKHNIETVTIRPGVSILSVLRHLNYRPWFAIAEFVDNSLQSFLAYRAALESSEGENFQLKVSIEITPDDGGHIVIRDNAAGIHHEAYARAFRPAEIPPDRTGLAEFGMGMKSAACWFSPKWTVRSSALGEPVERTITFDINSIINDAVEELQVKNRRVEEAAHYTEVVLSKLHRPLQARTIGKIKEHLASIYRVFLRDGTMQLTFNEDPLSFLDWEALTKPFFKTPDAAPVTWRKEIDFDFGGGQSVHGFAALFERASISNAGFALFRRNRLIQGSVDDGYRPEKIFGSQNKFTYQRLFGELHLEGFEVSHTKDGFRWEDDEEVFIQLLKDHLNAPPLPLLDQAEGHRVRSKMEDLKKGAEIATRHTAEVIERGVAPVLEKQIEEEPESRSLPKILRESRQTASEREIRIIFQGFEWIVRLELTCDSPIEEWLTISDQPKDISKSGDPRRLGIRISMLHPFMEQFGGKDPSEIEPLLRLGVAIALAEVTARESGVKSAGTIRRNINELLANPLSSP